MSFNLPHTTEVSKPLPKKAIFAKFGLKAAQRDRFDEDISRLVIAHEITTRSVPALATVDIQAIFVVTVLLKRRDFDRHNIELLTKLIPQKMVIALLHDEQMQFAIFHERLFFAPWQPADEASLPLTGLSLDDVWQSFVTTIGDINIKDGNSLTEQITLDEQQEKLRKQIAALEKKLNKEKQFNIQRQIFAEIKELKKQLK